MFLVLKTVFISSVSLICVVRVRCEVTVYPEVSSALPNYPFSDNDKLCFNKYYELQQQYNKEERVKWKCPEKTCETSIWCCMSFKIIDKVKALQGKVDECQVGWFSQTYVNQAVGTMVDTISKDCSEPFVYESQECKDMEKAVESGKTYKYTTTEANPKGEAAVEGSETTVTDSLSTDTTANTDSKIITSTKESGYCSHSVTQMANTWICMIVVLVAILVIKY